MKHSKLIKGVHFAGYHWVWTSMLIGLTTNNLYFLYWPAVIFITLHFIGSQHRERDFGVCMPLAILGLVIDKALIHFGIITFIAPLAYPTIWLALLWISFTLTFPYALNFLWKKPLNAGLFGALGFVGVYKLLDSMIVVETTHIDLFIIAITWFIVFSFGTKCFQKVKTVSL